MKEANRDLLRVEVVYALPEQQTLLGLDVVAGTTAHQAVMQSGILDQYPQIDLSTVKIGIFGKLAVADTELMDKDRVEIYRPLIADPKEVRKQRAAADKKMKRSSGDL